MLTSMLEVSCNSDIETFHPWLQTVVLQYLLIRSPNRSLWVHNFHFWQGRLPDTQGSGAKGGGNGLSGLWRLPPFVYGRGKGVLLWLPLAFPSWRSIIIVTAKTLTALMLGLEFQSWRGPSWLDLYHFRWQQSMKLFKTWQKEMACLLYTSDAADER